MIRLIANITIGLLANALGLFMAALILDGFKISGLAFFVAVIVFTLVYVISDPLISRIAENNMPALRGGVSLVTTFVGLLLTNLITDGISIDGVSTWLLATLIVWLFSLIATVILPIFVFKKTLQKIKS